MKTQYTIGIRFRSYINMQSQNAARQKAHQGQDVGWPSK